jgi:hypothetical protein
MLTDRQRRRCAAIAGALDRGDLSLWQKAELSLSVAERALIWDLRQHVVAKRKQRDAVPSKRPAPPKTEDDQDDLGPQGPGIDDWPEPAPGDSDDGDSPPEEEEPSKVCPMCRGSGRNKSGSRCSDCNGTGRIPSVIDDDDNDNDEFESLMYEEE